MTLSAKLCIALVALALTAGGALAATTAHGSKSNSDNKTTTGGTPQPMGVQGRVQLDSDWNDHQATGNTPPPDNIGPGRYHVDGCTKGQRAHGVWKAPAGRVATGNVEWPQSNTPAKPCPTPP